MTIFSIRLWRSVKDWYSFRWVSVLSPKVPSSSARLFQSSMNVLVISFCCRAISTLFCKKENKSDEDYEYQGFSDMLSVTLPASSTLKEKESLSSIWLTRG